MRGSTLERTQFVPLERAQVFAFFADAHNLAAITPPWLHFRIASTPVELCAGALIRYRLRIKGIPAPWLTEITDWRPPRTFTDVQLLGPYLVWEHTHRITPVPGGTEVFDHVHYVVPGGLIASLVDRLVVRPPLDEIFDYRAERMKELLMFSEGPEK
jgi:ligand-binding SRPBCC domain-containing protein